MGDQWQQEAWKPGWPCREDCRSAKAMGVAGWLWCEAEGRCDRLLREGQTCPRYEPRSAGPDGAVASGRGCGEAVAG
ncbi:MAG: hypothetical protein MUE42_09850 [Opitutaceae bacterium]|jgi:hypothetical protein|nr:hypothetical protein [Opitutaceae bacterium]